MKREFLLCAMVALCLLTGCGKKENTNIIITHKVAPEKPKGPQKMNAYEQDMDVSWIGKTYRVEMKREPDESLPKVDDGSGCKYYDNRITVRVRRADGSLFFDRTFTKNDFTAYVDPAYKSDCALLGVVFDRAEGDDLYFAASLGSPDEMSDEYVPLVVKLNRMGGLSIKKDTKLDVDNPEIDDDEDGV